MTYTLFSAPKKFKFLLRESFKLYKKTFFATLPPFIVFCLIEIILFAYNLHKETLHGKHYQLPFFSLANFLYGIAIVYIYTWFLRTIDNIAKHRQENLKTTLAWSCKRYLHLVSAFLIISALFYIGYRLFIFPAVFVAFSFLLVAYPIAIDNENVFNAMKKSFQYIWAYWWQISFSLGSIYILFIFLDILFIAATLGLCFITIGHSPQVYRIAIFISAAIPMILVTLWTWNFLYLVYYNIYLLKLMKNPYAIVLTSEAQSIKDDPKIINLALTIFQEFGPRGSIPVTDRFKEIFPKALSEQIASLIQCCKEIESFAWKIAISVLDKEETEANFRKKLQEQYPYLSESRINTTISQAMYFASR